MGKKIIVSFSIEETLVREIETLADAQGISRSLYVQRVMREAMENERAMIAAMNSPALRETLTQFFGKPGIVREMAKAMNDPITTAQQEKLERTLPAALELLPGLLDDKPKTEGNKRRRSRKDGKRVRKGVVNGKRKNKL